LGSGCTGTKADGSTGNVQFAASPATTPPSGGGTAPHTAATGSYSAISGASTNYARFVFISDFATSGCTVTFSDGSTVTSTTATIVFTAGGPSAIACAFSPRTIVSDGSS